MSQWHARIGGTVIGPFSSGEIRNMARTGRLAPEDEVFKENGDGRWYPAMAIDGIEFRRLHHAAEPTVVDNVRPVIPPPLPPIAEAVIPTAIPVASRVVTRPTKTRKPAAMLLGAIAVCCVLYAVLRPDPYLEASRLVEVEQQRADELTREMNAADAEQTMWSQAIEEAREKDRDAVYLRIEALQSQLKYMGTSSRADATRKEIDAELAGFKYREGNGIRLYQEKVAPAVAKYHAKRHELELQNARLNSARKKRDSLAP